jgi:hypothetical protein
VVGGAWSVGAPVVGGADVAGFDDDSVASAAAGVARSGESSSLHAAIEVATISTTEIATRCRLPVFRPYMIVSSSSQDALGPV